MPPPFSYTQRETHSANTTNSIDQQGRPIINRLDEALHLLAYEEDLNYLLVGEWLFDKGSVLDAFSRNDGLLKGWCEWREDAGGLGSTPLQY